MVPLSVLWLAFGGLMEGIVVAEHGPTIMAVGGAIFVAFGVYLVFGRFVHKRRRTLRSLYVVTYERALIIIGSGLYDSVGLDQPVLAQRSRQGNHITIRIGRAGYWRARPSILRNTGLDFIDVLHREPVTFYDVPDAHALWTALGTAGGT